MALNLLNIYTLIFASFSKINEMSHTLEKMRENVSRPGSESPSSGDGVQLYDYDYLTGVSPVWDENLSSIPEWYQNCRNITIPCSMTATVGVPLIFGISIFTSTISKFATTKSLDDQLSTTSTPQYTTDISTSNPPMFSNLNFSQSILDTNVSSSLDLENITSTSEAMSEEKEVLSDYVDSEFFDFIPDSDIDPREMFGSYMSENDTYNITKSNKSENKSSNDTDFENTTQVTSSVHLSTLNVDFGNSTESENLSSGSHDENVSTFSPTHSSVSESSSTEESMCVVTECDPIIKPTTKTSAPTTPVSKKKTKHTHSTTSTTGLYDSGFPSQTWSKKIVYHKREDLTLYISSLDTETRKKLVPLCWETMFGREMVKLTVMDLVMTVISTLMVDFFRAVFVRFMNNCWCWDLEKKFPQYGDFKIAENILHLVNNQGMVWMGMFFSPGLPIINVIKLAIMMYLRSWAVLTCNVPHEVVFRASRSNNFYMALLLTMLFLCVLPVGYAVVWVVPSWHCGPFSTYHRIYHIFTSSLKTALPYEWLHKAFDYIASPSIVIPLLMLLVLIIYYLISLTSALREANNDLKIQLRRERTEERRKMFQMVDKKRQEAENPTLKWKKAMPNFPYGKLSIADIPIDLLKVGAINGTAHYESAQKELVEEFMKQAKRMPSGTSEEENVLMDAGDGTDAEQHDSLPYDIAKHPKYAELIVKKDRFDKKFPKDEELKKRNGKNQIFKDKHSSSKEGEGSENSAWSEIPEIRIIQTESTENLDDVGNQSPNEKKFSKSKNKKARSDSLQQIRKRHGKTSRTRQSSKDGSGDEKNLQSDTSQISPKNSKRSHKATKGSSSKTEGEASLDTVGSENENSDNGSLSENDNKEVVDKTCDKARLNRFKIAISASQAMRSKVSNIKNQNSEIIGEVKKVHRSKNTKNNDESIHSKPHKSKSKKRKEDQLNDNVPEASQESEGNSLGSGTESDNDSTENLEQSQGESEVSDNDTGSKNKGESESEHSISKDNESNDSKKSSKSLKKRSNSTETEGSDVSSQNTVKQTNLSRQDKKKNDTASNEDEIYDRNSKTQSSKENSKKTIARFKIANVLLKEARRRSSSGLEEK